MNNVDLWVSEAVPEEEGSNAAAASAEIGAGAVAVYNAGPPANKEEPRLVGDTLPAGGDGLVRGTEVGRSFLEG